MRSFGSHFSMQNHPKRRQLDISFCGEIQNQKWPAFPTVESTKKQWRAFPHMEDCKGCRTAPPVHGLLYQIHTHALGETKNKHGRVPLWKERKNKWLAFPPTGKCDAVWCGVVWCGLVWCMVCECVVVAQVNRANWAQIHVAVRACLGSSQPG